ISIVASHARGLEFPSIVLEQSARPKSDLYHDNASSCFQLDMLAPHPRRWPKDSFFTQSHTSRAVTCMRLVRFSAPTAQTSNIAYVRAPLLLPGRRRLMAQLKFIMRRGPPRRLRGAFFGFRRRMCLDPSELRHASLKLAKARQFPPAAIRPANLPNMPSSRRA